MIRMSLEPTGFDISDIGRGREVPFAGMADHAKWLCEEDLLEVPSRSRVHDIDVAERRQGETVPGLDLCQPLNAASSQAGVSMNLVDMATRKDRHLEVKARLVSLGNDRWKSAKRLVSHVTDRYIIAAKRTIGSIQYRGFDVSADDRTRVIYGPSVRGIPSGSCRFYRLEHCCHGPPGGREAI